MFTSETSQLREAVLVANVPPQREAFANAESAAPNLHSTVTLVNTTRHTITLSELYYVVILHCTFVVLRVPIAIN